MSNQIIWRGRICHDYQVDLDSWDCLQMPPNDRAKLEWLQKEEYEVKNYNGCIEIFWSNGVYLSPCDVNVSNLPIYCTGIYEAILCSALLSITDNKKR